MTPAGTEWAAWRETLAPLRAFVSRRAPAGVEADDLVQEVMLRMVKELPRLRSHQRIEAWMYRIARNAITDALRTRARGRRLVEQLAVEPTAAPVGGNAAGVGGDTRDVRAELAGCLAPLLQRLEPGQRTALELSDLGALTQAEAAARQGVSLSGMKSRVQRARARLREILLACCAVVQDGRGGVAEFQPHTGSCQGCAAGGV